MTGAEFAGPEIAVVIPHLNDTARLTLCLTALLPEGVPPGVEVVVADNGSTEDVAGAVASFPGVRLVTESAPGAGPARNRGAAETTAPRLLFLDADCVPAPGLIEAARRALETADLAGGRITVFDETAPPRTGAQALETVLAFDQERYVTRLGFSATANLATWRRVFDAVGGFRTGVAEDVDWCHRARALGCRIAYAPQMAVAHPTRADWPALRRKWRRLTAESFALHLDGGGSRARWAARAVAVAGSPVRDVPRILGHRGLDGSGERRRGAATLVGLRLLRSLWMLCQALGLPFR